MLIRFAVCNFCSFNEEIEFTMIPTKEKAHRDWHLYKPGGSIQRELLHTAVLYGANASGKSNFIKAFEFAAKIVTKGTRPNRPISNPTFKLDKACKKSPSRFLFEIQSKEKMYSYSIHLSNDAIQYEKLSELSKKSEKIVFIRKFENDETTIEFGPVIEKQSKEFQENIRFVAKGTRKNQLFLTDTVERNIDLLRPVYDWFNDSVRILSPKSVGHGVEFRLGNDEHFTDFLRILLSEFDPSITNISSLVIDAEKEKDLPVKIMHEIENEIDDDGAVFMADVVNGSRFVVLKKEGELKILKMFIERKFDDSDELVTFNLEEESDGTRRLIDLAPLLFELLFSDEIVVAFVDELDRSLHPMTTKALLEIYLKVSSQTNSMSQIIISTHNSVLFDPELLRRDEIWLMNKKNGASELISLQRTFSPRYDKDIRKEYLEGLYGGVPSLRKDNLYEELLKGHKF